MENQGVTVRGCTPLFARVAVVVAVVNRIDRDSALLLGLGLTGLSARRRSLRS